MSRKYSKSEQRRIAIQKGENFQDQNSEDQNSEDQNSEDQNSETEREELPPEIKAAMASVMEEIFIGRGVVTMRRLLAVCDLPPEDVIEAVRELSSENPRVISMSESADGELPGDSGAEDATGPIIVRASAPGRIPGASDEWLLRFTARGHREVVRHLETFYRSSVIRREEEIQKQNYETDSPAPGELNDHQVLKILLALMAEGIGAAILDPAYRRMHVANGIQTVRQAHRIICETGVKDAWKRVSKVCLDRREASETQALLDQEKKQENKRQNG